MFLRTKDYVPAQMRGGVARTHIFFSTFPPDEIFSRLKQQLDAAKQEWTLKPPTWKIEFTASKQIGQGGAGTTCFGLSGSGLPPNFPPVHKRYSGPCDARGAVTFTIESARPKSNAGCF